ncbi:hypothetical protein QJQ45_008745 [Haematococcus lacustris]|nr:hypothetical protein QJQ45_008745 [Haematococcus lacustris]
MGWVQEREQVRYQEERQLEEQRAQVGARMKQYEDELTRKRMMAEHELQRQRNAELVKLQEEASARQEAERLRIEQQIQASNAKLQQTPAPFSFLIVSVALRRSIRLVDCSRRKAERRAAEAYAADMQKQIQRERALAEAEGRAKEARENEDINRRAALLKYQEEGRAAIEYLNALMANLGSAAVELLTDSNKLATTLGATGALFALLFGTREGARVVGGAVERWLGTPKLVRETSRFNVWKPSSWRSTPAKGTEEIKKDFSDIILPGGLHNNVRMLAASAANTRKHGAPFRHMLFYDGCHVMMLVVMMDVGVDLGVAGPPGTGKTMAAKRLARTSGLDYAIMSGGDVAPLEGKAVTQLHQAFDWAERSSKGLLLFIDEADAFLGRRSDAMSEGLRGALNALLFRTGDQSKDFMVVIATNRPGDLDDAVLDRMDEALEFALPREEERLQLLRLYLDK